jgi:hypothetical protein
MTGCGQCAHERADRHHSDACTASAGSAAAHLGLVGVRLGQPALFHALPDLHLRPLFRRRRHRKLHGERAERTGGRRAGAKPLVAGPDGVGHPDRALCADPRRLRGQHRAADAVDRAFLGLLRRGRRGAVVHAAGRILPCGRADRLRHRPDRGGVHDDLHQLHAARTGRRQRDRAAVGHRVRVGLHGRRAGALHHADLLRGRRERDDLRRLRPRPRPGPGGARRHPFRRALRGGSGTRSS